MNPKLKDELFQTIFNAAQEKGEKAANKCTPTPMVVQQHESPLNDNSKVIQSWHVDGGVCGFAWVVITPGTCSFARWLSKHRLGGKNYYGGVSIYIHGYGQSYERKMSHAAAMANYLNEVGINARADGRLD